MTLLPAGLEFGVPSLIDNVEVRGGGDAEKRIQRNSAKSLGASLPHFVSRDQNYNCTARIILTLDQPIARSFSQNDYSIDIREFW